MTAVLLALFSAAGYGLSDFLYLHCMISPIRGDFTGFRVQVPLGHRVFPGQLPGDVSSLAPGTPRVREDLQGD
jgi:hypothetical protein